VLDVAIIGAGLMGRWHLATAQSLGARVVAIVDRDIHAATGLARLAPAALTGTSLAVLGDRPVMAAHVCTPTATHAEIAFALAAIGVHAFVEKPLAGSASVTGSVLEAARRAGVQVCPVHQYAFQPGVERALIAMRTLGPLHRIDFNICSAGADRGAISPGDLVNEILPHPISILQRLMPGAPAASLQWAILRSKPGELLATAAHEGVLISIFVSAHARPTCMNTHIQCGSGSIDINGFHGYAVVNSGDVSRSAKISAPFMGSLRTLAAASSNLVGRSLRREPAYPGLKSLTRLFYAAIAVRGGAGPPIDSATILEGAAVRDVLTAEVQDSRRRQAS